MKRIWALMVVIVLSVLAFAGCGGGTAPQAQQKKIVIGLDDNFPPMGFRDEKGEIVGFDVDMAKEAAKRLNLQVEFKPIDWSAKEAELNSKRIDVLWNGLDITEKRKANILFSEPYMKCRQIIFTAPNSPIKSIDDLKGKIVAVQDASTADEIVEADLNLKNSFKELKKYPDFMTAFMDLQAGRIDAIIGDEPVGRYYVAKDPGKFKIVDQAVGAVGIFGVGFRKDDRELRDKVQKVLDEMKKDGTSAKISQKWFGKDITM